VIFIFKKKRKVVQEKWGGRKADPNHRNNFGPNFRGKFSKEAERERAIGAGKTGFTKVQAPLAREDRDPRKKDPEGQVRKGELPGVQRIYVQ